MKIGRGRSKSMNSKERLSLALYLLMGKKPYADITVKELCTKAGLSRMSFYRIYKNKDDILIDYCDERFADFFEILDAIDDPSWEDLFMALFTYLKHYQRQINKLRETGMQYLLLKQFQSYINYLSTKAKSPSIRSAIKNRLSSAFISGGMFMITLAWAEEGFVSSPEEMTKLTLETFSR